jgi:hypothetical protein
MNLLHLPCHNNNTYIWRIGELEYLSSEYLSNEHISDNNLINVLHKDDDCLWVRSVPELITNKELEIILEEESNYSTVYNTYNNFYEWNCKEQAFNKWRSLGLNTPEYIIVNSTNDVLDFCKIHQKHLLRINNDFGKRDTFFLDFHKNSFCALLDKSYKTLADKLTEKQKTDTTTKIICVEYLNDSTPHHKQIRSYVINNKVVLSYDNGQQCSANDFSPKYNNKGWNSFINRNKELSLSTEIETQLKTAVSCFGLYMSSVDWILKDDKCYLLELNPYWGMGYQSIANGFPFYHKWANEVRAKYNDLPDNLQIRLDTNNFWDLIYKNAFPHLFE